MRTKTMTMLVATDSLVGAAGATSPQELAVGDMTTKLGELGVATVSG